MVTGDAAHGQMYRSSHFVVVWAMLWVPWVLLYQVLPLANGPQLEFSVLLTTLGIVLASVLVWRFLVTRSGYEGSFLSALLAPVLLAGMALIGGIFRPDALSIEFVYLFPVWFAAVVVGYGFFLRFGQRRRSAVET